MTRRRTLAVLSGIAAVSIGVSAWAVAPSSIPVRTAVESRVVHLYREGPAGFCDTDVCGIGILQPMKFRLPAASTSYSGTVTVSLSYSTTGNGIFDLGPRLSTVGHRRGTILPGERRVAPTAYPTSTTLIYRVLDVPAETPLDLELSLNIGRRATSKTSFTSHNVVVELRVSPAG